MLIQTLTIYPIRLLWKRLKRCYFLNLSKIPNHAAISINTAALLNILCEGRQSDKRDISDFQRSTFKFSTILSPHWSSHVVRLIRICYRTIWHFTNSVYYYHYDRVVLLLLLRFVGVWENYDLLETIKCLINEKEVFKQCVPKMDIPPHQKQVLQVQYKYYIYLENYLWSA